MSLSPFVSFQSRFVTYLLTYSRTVNVSGDKLHVLIQLSRYVSLKKNVIIRLSWNSAFMMTYFAKCIADRYSLVPTITTMLIRWRLC